MCVGVVVVPVVSGAFGDCHGVGFGSVKRCCFGVHHGCGHVLCDGEGCEANERQPDEYDTQQYPLFPNFAGIIVVKPFSMRHTLTPSQLLLFLLLFLLFSSNTELHKSSQK